MMRTTVCAAPLHLACFLARVDDLAARPDFSAPVMAVASPVAASPETTTETIGCLSLLVILRIRKSRLAPPVGSGRRDLLVEGSSTDALRFRREIQ